MGQTLAQRRILHRNRFSAQAFRYEVEHGYDLLTTHVELLYDLVDTEVFEVLDDRGHRQARAFEHPSAANFAWDTFDGWAPGPIKGCHTNSFASDYGKIAWPSRGLERRLGDRLFASTSRPSGSNSRKCDSSSFNQ